ncbi:hypothetical protein TSUD_33450 [Trifolium subterraneum]|uniref:Reverse transcriptase domain-containing protein n=1 Tax=Trifolium subterraneum TaxID=3900 RepID=A0A2Z6LPP1_TRISU|nr:hypothetical protein TSUD_33450 [Trifolium subterraneum]
MKFHQGSVERTEFVQFIDAMELIDIPVLGKKFTWSNSDNSVMSRLDRFLLSEGIIEKGGITNQWVGDRDISDHHPIWLECNNLNWGPKPFKFNNCWLEHKDFIPVVKATWESLNINGRKAHVLKEKMKRLKEELKVWNKEVFGILDLNIDKTVKDLNEVEELIANGDNHPLHLNSKEIAKKFWEQLHFKESILKQKSRSKWIKKGDSNTCYFHATIKGRRRRNHILKIKKGVEWLQGVADIKNAAKDHFSKHFKEEWDNRPFLQGSLYKILSKILANRLKKVLGNLISNCQSAFLPQRQILDGVVVLNEIIDLANRRKDECLLFKVDFERAYDTAERGLRQGDPLSPFLFLIVAEGLSMLMKRAVEIGKFKGYQINHNIQFQILQFADDTILLGEASWENILTIKTVLRGFELVSGLKINFVKSKLYGINVDSRQLSAGSSFLSCRAETIPFKFLGVSVRANPRRKETWKPVVDAMNKRLSTWTSRHLSFGGRLTLINSVLSSLPLYFFSFFKLPSCILKILEQMQRNLLWGGGAENKKICWVKWDQICLPKAQGGLGVKNLCMFNVALLNKWKWRFVSENEALWTDFLRFRYGQLPTQLVGEVTTPTGAKSSLWWRDLLGMEQGTATGCFKHHVRACVGNGRNIGFWNFKWFGNQTFSDLFPNLYEKERYHNASIADRLGDYEANDTISWQWIEPLTEDEERQVVELSELLVGFSLQPNNHDHWRWIPESNGMYSVKSFYNILLNYRDVAGLDPNVLNALNHLWRTDIPSKALVFGWRLLFRSLTYTDGPTSLRYIT